MAIHDLPARHELAAWSGQSPGMTSPHRHDELELNWVNRGRMTYLIGGHVTTLPNRRLCALWGAVPHQTVRTGPDAPQLIWVTVPLPELLAWELPDRFMRQLLEGQVIVDPNPRPADEPMLQQWIADLARQQPNHRIVLLEIEARLHRLAESLTASPPARTNHPNPRQSHDDRLSTGLATVQRMTQFIAEHYTQPIHARQIAQAGHVHPNYAMHLFRKHLRMTMHQYLTRQRIAHAQRLLATTKKPVLQIALDSGFNSLSRFFEMFKQHHGCTPRQFRQNMGRSAAAPS